MTLCAFSGIRERERLVSGHCDWLQISSKEVVAAVELDMDLKRLHRLTMT